MARRLVITAFGTLAALTGLSSLDALRKAVLAPTLDSWLTAGYGVLRLAIVGAFLVFVITRAPARRSGREPLAVAACACAIVPVILLQRPGAAAPPGVVLAGEAFAGLATVWMFAAVLALGRCFSVLPEARGLVTSGPYRLVRHPVYLGELGACFGMLVASFSIRNALAATVFGIAQFVRMRLEEHALEAEFPEYADYASHTPRLMPRVRISGRLVASREAA